MQGFFKLTTAIPTAAARITGGQSLIDTRGHSPLCILYMQPDGSNLRHPTENHCCDYQPRWEKQIVYQS
jgi:hypothetical protein